MDCVTFRRQLLEDPLRNGPDILAHEEQCPSCAEYARRTRADEARLRAILNVSPTPELVERIKLAASFEAPTGEDRRRRLLATAAGFILLATAVSMGWFLSPLERSTYSLADSVLHHVRDEAHHMREVGPVAPWQLDALFDAYGARLTGDLGQVNFAAKCLMRKKTGIHLVLPGEVGPITVFYMPAEPAGAVMSVEDERFNGYVWPTLWGSIAVIGEAGERLEGLAERLIEAVAWPASLAGMTHVTTPRA